MNYHPTKSLVAGFCQNCNQIFYRDGDLMAFSTSYSTPFYSLDMTIDKVKTYRDWLMFSSDFCDTCLPMRPIEVDNDIAEEEKRKQADIANYHATKAVYNIPGHESKESYIERKQDNVKNYSIERGSVQREGNIRKKISRHIPNALCINRRHS